MCVWPLQGHQGTPATALHGNISVVQPAYCPACCPYMPICFSKEKINAQVCLPGKALLSFPHFPFREPPLFFFLHQPFILAFFREAATLRAAPKASPQTPKLLFYCDLELTLKIKISNTSYLFCLLLVPRYHDSNYVLQPHHLSNLTTEFYSIFLNYIILHSFYLCQ